MSTDADETILMFKAGVDEMTGLDDRFCWNENFRYIIREFFGSSFWFNFLVRLFLFKVFLLLT